MSHQTRTTPAVRPTATQPAARPVTEDGTRSPAQIEADLEVTRERLAVTVDLLVDRVHPKAVATRSLAKAKDAVVDEHGNPRTERIVKVAAVAGGAVLGVMLLRRLLRRH